MGSVDMHLENRYEHEEERYPNRNERDGECGPLIQYEGRNARDSDDQYLKSIKLDIPTFDSRLDPQLFLEWLRHLDKYFTWYSFSEDGKVKFAIMKLTGQANQYWTNVKAMRASQR